MEASNSMNEEKLLEELTELKIRLAMAGYAEMEGGRLAAENEILEKDIFYQPDDKVRSKFRKELNRHYRKQQAGIVFGTCRKVLNKAAVIAFLLTAALSASVFTVEAVRIRVLNFILDTQEEYTQIRFGDNGGGNIIGDNLYINWEDAYAPKDIPEGYSLSSLTNDKNVKAVGYSDANDNRIIFQQWTTQSVVNVDTEDADGIEKVTVQGFEGLLVTKDDLITVSWSNNTHIFLLDVYGSNLSDREVLKIAESVVRLK